MADEGRSWSGNERNRCFLNTGQTRFADVSALSGLDSVDDGRALAVSDWDGDGDLDLFQVNRTAPQVRFLRNDWQDGSRWLALRLVGTECNRDAIGARVELYRKGLPHKDMRTVYAGCSFLSQSTKWVHFGLGENTDIGRVVVRWPGSSVETFTGLKAGTRYRLVQGSGRAEPVPLRQPATQLRPSLPSVPDISERARVVLRAPAPLPELEAKQFNEHPLAINWGQPTLLQLWVSWCPMCRAELTEFTQRADDVSQAGIRVVALSVDGLGQDESTPERAREAIRRLGFPLVAGLATESLLEKLEILRGELFSNRLPYPVPTSFLIDAQGQLVAVYLGPLEVEQLLDDLDLLQVSLERRHEMESTLGGRRFTSPRPIALSGLVSAFRDAGYDDDAAWYKQRAAPQMALAYCGIAADAERLGDLEMAAALYKKALRLDPQSAKAHNYYGEYLMRRRVTAEALASFRKAIELDRELAIAHHNLATVYLLQRQLADAVKGYREAIRIDPRLAKAQTALGRLFQQVGRHAEAAVHFEAALAADRNLAPAHVYLGLARVHQQRLDDARQHFAEAIRISPDLADAHEGLGSVLAAQGKTAEAIRHMREAIHLNPGSRQATLKLAWYLSTSPDAKNRDGNEALRLALRVAKATNMQSPLALDVLASAYAEVGQFQQAVKTSKTAAQLAHRGSKPELAQQIGLRQALYQRNQPFRRQVASSNK